jgi:hypothetical protein
LRSPQWIDTPEDHSYTDARDYLSLMLGDEQADQGVELLRETPVITRKAKDILRASGHKLAPADDPAVGKVFDKVRRGEPLSPVLLFRAYPMIIADGFHRVCALYHLDPDIGVLCQIT